MLTKKKKKKKKKLKYKHATVHIVNVDGIYTRIRRFHPILRLIINTSNIYTTKRQNQETITYTIQT